MGPDEDGCSQTGRLVDLFCKHWGGKANWINRWDGGPHEASFLKLDCSRMKATFGWQPVWTLEKAIEQTIQWTKCYAAKGDVRACMEEQMADFFSSIQATPEA